LILKFTSCAMVSPVNESFISGRDMVAGWADRYGTIVTKTIAIATGLIKVVLMITFFIFDYNDTTIAANFKAGVIIFYLSQFFFVISAIIIARPDKAVIYSLQ
jgi:hypothetical protein